METKEILEKFSAVAAAEAYVKNLRQYLTIVANQRAAVEQAKAARVEVVAKLDALPAELVAAAVEVEQLRAIETPEVDLNPEQVKRLAELEQKINAGSGALERSAAELEALASSPIGFGTFTIRDIDGEEVEAIVNALLAIREAKLEQMKAALVEAAKL